MKTRDKVATVVFWSVVGVFGLVVAFVGLLIGIRIEYPLLVIGSLVVIVLAPIGLRECVRALRKHEDLDNAV